MIAMPGFETISKVQKPLLVLYAQAIWRKELKCFKRLIIQDGSIKPELAFILDNKRPDSIWSLFLHFHTIGGEE